MGGLNTDILRYSADILNTTLKLWGKHEWKCRLSQHVCLSFSSIFSFHPTKHSISSVLMHATAPRLSAHTVLYRGDGCHKRARTLISRGQSQLSETFDFSRVSQCAWYFLYQTCPVSISCFASFHLALITQFLPLMNKALNVRSGYHYHLQG